MSAASSHNGLRMYSRSPLSDPGKIWMRLRRNISRSAAVVPLNPGSRISISRMLCRSGCSDSCACSIVTPGFRRP